MWKPPYNLLSNRHLQRPYGQLLAEAGEPVGETRFDRPDSKLEGFRNLHMGESIDVVHSQHDLARRRKRIDVRCEQCNQIGGKLILVFFGRQKIQIVTAKRFAPSFLRLRSVHGFASRNAVSPGAHPSRIA